MRMGSLLSSRLASVPYLKKYLSRSSTVITGMPHHQEWHCTECGKGDHCRRANGWMALKLAVSQRWYPGCNSPALGGEPSLRGHWVQTVQCEYSHLAPLCIDRVIIIVIIALTFHLFGPHFWLDLSMMLHFDNHFADVDPMEQAVESLRKLFKTFHHCFLVLDLACTSSHGVRKRTLNGGSPTIKMKGREFSF